MIAREGSKKPINHVASPTPAKRAKRKRIARIPPVIGDALLVSDVVAGQMMDVCRTRVHALANEGAIRRVKIGGSTRFSVADLRAYVAKIAA